MRGRFNMAPGGLVLAFLMLFAGFSSAVQAQQIACPVTTTVAVADGSNNTDHCNIATTGTLVVGNNIAVTNESNSAFMSVDGSIVTSGLLNNTGGIVITNPSARPLFPAVSARS